MCAFETQKSTLCQPFALFSPLKLLGDTWQIDLIPGANITQHYLSGQGQILSKPLAFYILRWVL